MVKRVAILFPDASLTIMSGQNGEAAATVQARKEVGRYNKDERNPDELARLGTIEINLATFQEKP